MASKVKKRSGRTLTQAERLAAGRGRMTWRPRLEALEALGDLAGRWGVSPGEAIERAVLEALAREDAK